MNQRLNRDDIRRAVGQSSFARGSEYLRQNRVLQAQASEPAPERLQLRSRVRGSGAQIYQQEIEIRFDTYMPQINGVCSCPMRHNCKHVAAACLHYLEQGFSTEPSQRGAWQNWLERLASAGGRPAPRADEERLVFLLSTDDSVPPVLQLELRWVRPRKEGGYTKGRRAGLDTLYFPAQNRSPLDPETSDIVNLLRALAGGSWVWQQPRIEGNLGYLALTRMIDTGRCFWLQPGDHPLRAGAARPVELTWREDHQGLHLVLDLGGQIMLLPTEPPLYLDLAEQTVGPVEAAGLRGAQLQELLRTPPLPKSLAADLSRELLTQHPELPVPPPARVRVEQIDGELPRPRLLIGQIDRGRQHLPVAFLSFAYAGQIVPGAPGQSRSIIESGGRTWIIRRDLTAEAAACQRLAQWGLFPVEGESSRPSPLALLMQDDNPVLAMGRWAEFLDQGVEELRRTGWEVALHEGFEIRFDAAEWLAEIDQQEADTAAGWFSLRFDLEVDGERLPLLPLIAPLLELPADTPLPQIVSLPHPQRPQSFISLPSARLAPFLDTLRELFERARPRPDGQLQLSRSDARVLEQLSQAGTIISGDTRLQELAARLADFSGIAEVAPPAGLQARLRPYQQAGLNWLQFLREYQLGGILADDMGLGKTLQTLAHLLLEKEAGRLDDPCLLVAPTSLVGNWRREACRFCPDLRVLVLHGTSRADHFAEIDRHDLVLTTYPLLTRDQDALFAHRYHSLILDEAQTIKNPRTQAARVLRRISARHRLCLTGTPMENHLGELWALFDFLMPGFLGDQPHFTRHWRKPIESEGDDLRRQQLAKRIAPFMLRRRKQDVLADLPAKTEIIRSVALGPRQAALYESIRLAMEKEVRDTIAAQGFARSQITILDALLKLRQTCCHPPLVKLPQAAKVAESAKLELLLDLLPEQLEEGRRILLFSQFTRMLDAIAEVLERRRIRYLRLTGETRDRDEVVDAFRRGDADLFLISLKAGGVGLNLTEADTVILYDPWWNPAVEQQAADRAHRIGQDKPVFVYKLITEGTVEERILALQARKQALADGIYAEGEAGATQLTAEDLGELLAPLSDG